MNIISNDRLVQAIFDVVGLAEVNADEKLKAVIRAGKIAEAYRGGGAAFEVAQKSLESLRSNAGESH